MKKYLFLLAFFGFLFARCNKDDNTFLGDHTIAQGIITEEGSGKPVANVQMRLRKCTYILFGSSSCETIDSTRTDAQGFFSFDFKHEKEYQYEIRAVPNSEKYFVKNGDFPFDKGRLNNKINMILTPYAWIKLRIKKNAPIIYDSLALYGGPHGNPNWYVGYEIDSTLKFRVNGDRKAYIGWEIYRNGQKKLTETNIYCPPHDTVAYEINY